jgi:hypothetical protein
VGQLIDLELLGLELLAQKLSVGEAGGFGGQGEELGGQGGGDGLLGLWGEVVAGGGFGWG